MKWIKVSLATIPRAGPRLTPQYPLKQYTTDQLHPDLVVRPTAPFCLHSSVKRDQDLSCQEPWHCRTRIE